MTWSTVIWKEPNENYSGNIQGIIKSENIEKEQIREMIIKSLDDYLNSNL